MTLFFNPFEVAVLGVSVLIAGQIAADGESNVAGGRAAPRRLIDRRDGVPLVVTGFSSRTPWRAFCEDLENPGRARSGTRGLPWTPAGIAAARGKKVRSRSPRRSRPSLRFSEALGRSSATASRRQEGRSKERESTPRKSGKPCRPSYPVTLVSRGSRALKVDPANGVVTLTGRVATQADRDAVGSNSSSSVKGDPRHRQRDRPGGAGGPGLTGGGRGGPGRPAF